MGTTGISTSHTDLTAGGAADAAAELLWLDQLEAGSPVDVSPGSLVLWRHSELGWQWYVYERDEEVHRMAVSGFTSAAAALRAARAELVATPRALPAVVCHPESGDFFTVTG